MDGRLVFFGSRSEKKGPATHGPPKIVVQSNPGYNFSI